MIEPEAADFDNMDQQDLFDYFNDRLNRLAMTINDDMKAALVDWTMDIGWLAGYIGLMIQINQDIAFGYANALFCLGFNAGRGIPLPDEYVTAIDDLFDIWNTGDIDTDDAEHSDT